MTRKKPSRELWNRPLPCIACKIARKKCSLGRSPGCERCQRLGVSCEYNCSAAVGTVPKPQKQSQRKAPKSNPTASVVKMEPEAAFADFFTSPSPSVSEHTSIHSSPALTSTTNTLDQAAMPHLFELNMFNSVFPDYASLETPMFWTAAPTFQQELMLNNHTDKHSAFNALLQGIDQSIPDNDDSNWWIQSTVQ